jgi:hypothetical protein
LAAEYNAEAEQVPMVEVIDLEGETIWHKIFSTLLLADWTAVALAAEYNAEAEQVPMVEEFKKLMAE